MIKNKILADLHVHSIFSKHAYSSITENISQADLLGLKYLAITDHVFQEGKEFDIKNEAMRFQYLEKEINIDQPVYVLGGAEFNLFQVLQFKEKFKKLSWKIIGFHKFVGINMEYISLQKMYQEFKKYAEYVDGFAHIEREIESIEFNRYKEESLAEPIKSFLSSMVELAKKSNTYLELNESSLRSYNGLYDEQIIYWLSKAKELHCRIYLGSDSHYHKRVGKFEKSLALLKDLDYPEELVLNFDEDRIKKLITR